MSPVDLSAPLLLIADDRALPTATRLLDGLAELAVLSRPPAALGDGFAAALRQRYRRGQACVALAGTEAIIRALAAELAGSTAPTPVIAVAPDGTAVTTLLGAGDGLAARLSAALGIGAAGRASNAGSGPTQAARGSLTVVGLGPGTPALRAPAVQQALEAATDIVGYLTYLNLAGPFRPEQRLHGSDNRRELDRARLALDLATQGRRVVVVSSGDPGVFGMATAVLEAVDGAVGSSLAVIDLTILPGISAAQAAAARVGAPLGHDFCVLSLSDNLKPWAQIAQRLRLAARADLVIALYNPRSRARPGQFAAAMALLREARPATTPVVIARDVGRCDERVLTTTLAEVEPEQVDMRTVVIIGSSQTRCVFAAGGAWVYTPRWYPENTAAKPDGEMAHASR